MSFSTAKFTSWLGSLPFLGSVLRAAANRYAEGSVVTIRQGYVAGYRWRRNHRYVNGYWIGQYELPLQQALVGELKKGNTFFDVGANAGFFTLVAAKAVGSQGRCVAFDPSPVNHENIQEQLRLNCLRYCEAVMEAVADRDGREQFSFGAPGSPTGKLGQGGTREQTIDVVVTTIDRAVERFGVPNVIKMDIEGAEVKALEGAKDTLLRHRPTWIIELHGSECATGVYSILSQAGYVFLDLNGSNIPADRPLPQHVIARCKP